MRPDFLLVPTGSQDHTKIYSISEVDCPGTTGRLRPVVAGHAAEFGLHFHARPSLRTDRYSLQVEAFHIPPNIGKDAVVRESPTESQLFDNPLGLFCESSL